MGLVVYPLCDLATPQALIASADQAMYAAKQAGGHRIQVYQSRHDGPAGATPLGDTRPGV